MGFTCDMCYIRCTTGMDDQRRNAIVKGQDIWGVGVGMGVCQPATQPKRNGIRNGSGDGDGAASFLVAKAGVARRGCVCISGVLLVTEAKELGCRVRRLEQVGILASCMCNGRVGQCWKERVGFAFALLYTSDHQPASSITRACPRHISCASCVSCRLPLHRNH